MPAYGYFLSRVMQPVVPGPGASGYFSSPDESLDPALFVGEHFKPEIRRWVTDTLYNYWRTKYNRPEAWSTVWIAGSAISYQWSASRGGPGDLDVLIGINYVQFFMDNPQFRGLSQADLSAIFNQEMHTDLWPKTAHQILGGREFEVTFYVNPNSTDIRDINPYAAYNLSDDSWTVRPPSGDDFEHPKEFYASAEAEARQARQLVEQYNTLSSQARAMQPGSPGWHNAMSQVGLVVSQADSMYGEIHLGRKKAFSSTGSGYGDYYNFRWQYHKQQGTAQALHGVADAHKVANEQYNQQTYGGAISGADIALRRAVMSRRTR